MYLTIIGLPLLAAITAGLLGRKIGQSGAQLIASTAMFLTATLACIAFYEVGLNASAVSVNLMSWIDSELLNINWGFTFDSLTVAMLLPVVVVSALVHIYSIGYMSEDPHVPRFFSYLSMFTFCMLCLVAADNYLLLFLGWEGVGVSSYLLINFWFTRLQANKSAIKAMLINRVGDYLFTVGLFLIIWVFGTLEFSTVYAITPYIDPGVVSLICICLLIAAMGKSAQIGLHGWLPEAIEGPTPVSALIHAATMVTAGVYLLVRSSPIIEYSSTALIAVTFVGALTAFFAATTGLLQSDLKRVIAYSTASQLGYMVMAVGLSGYNVAIFHLINHAWFKALLFLSAGAVIHALADEQDQRRMGGLVGFLPFTYAIMLIGSLSLMALPFLTGWASKDLIIELASVLIQYRGSVAYWLGTLSAVFTAFYSIRLLALTFFTYPNGSRAAVEGAHEAPLIMAVPLVILAIFSIFFGYMTKDLFVGLGTGFWSNSIFIHPDHLAVVDAEFAEPTIYKLLPVFSSLFGAGLALALYHLYADFTISLTGPSRGREFYTFFNSKWFFDPIYNSLILYPLLNFGNITSKVLDRGSIELLGPYGLTQSINTASKNLTSYDSGFIPSYAMYILVGLVGYIAVSFYLGPKYLLLLIGLLLFLSSKASENQA
jgi:NADH-ubiquinone oxidoreductase chain 5